MRRRLTLSEAFRQAYETAGLSQQALSTRIGIDQPLISKYARGVVEPPLEVVSLVEEACGYRLGHILRLAGYVDDGPPDVLAALRGDPALTDQIDREALAELYRRLSARQPPGGAAGSPGPAGRDAGSDPKWSGLVSTEGVDANRDEPGQAPAMSGDEVSTRGDLSSEKRTASTVEVTLTDGRTVAVPAELLDVATQQQMLASLQASLADLVPGPSGHSARV